jgi:Tfp pilus assembly major pilin PilA
LSAFKICDNPVAVESEGMIDSRYKPIGFPPPGQHGDSKWMLERPSHAQEVNSTTVVKRFGATGSAATGEIEALRLHSEHSQGGNHGLHESPVSAPQTTPYAKRGPARTPPAKVQAYRKKLQELQARTSDVVR